LASDTKWYGDKGAQRWNRSNLSASERLLLTREKGRSVSEALPTGRNALHLDLGEVEAASPSFLGELARALFEKGIRSIVVTGATDHIVENLERVLEQRERVPARLGDDAVSHPLVQPVLARDQGDSPLKGSSLTGGHKIDQSVGDEHDIPRSPTHEVTADVSWEMARSKACSWSRPEGTRIVSRVFPSTWITSVTWSAAKASGSWVGQICR
jgi:hypothetical protein